MPTTSAPPKFQIQSSESPKITVLKLIDSTRYSARSTLIKAGFSGDQVDQIDTGNAFPVSNLTKGSTTSRAKLDATVIASLVLHSLREMNNAIQKGDICAAVKAAFFAGEYHEKQKAAQILSAQAKGGKSLTAHRRLAKDIRNALAAELSSKNPMLSLKELHGKVNEGKYTVSCSQFRTDFKKYKKQQALKTLQTQQSLDWVSKFLFSGAIGRK